MTIPYVMPFVSEITPAHPISMQRQNLSRKLAICKSNATQRDVMPNRNANAMSDERMWGILKKESNEHAAHRMSN